VRDPSTLPRYLPYITFHCSHVELRVGRTAQASTFRQQESAPSMKRKAESAVKHSSCDPPRESRLAAVVAGANGCHSVALCFHHTLY